MSAEHLANLVHFARVAGAAGPLESWASPPSANYKGAYVVNREVKRLRLANGVPRPMVIPVFGHILGRRRRGDLKLPVRAFHELLHAELFRSPNALQDGGRTTTNTKHP